MYKRRKDIFQEVFVYTKKFFDANNKRTYIIIIIHDDRKRDVVATDRREKNRKQQQPAMESIEIEIIISWNEWERKRLKIVKIPMIFFYVHDFRSRFRFDTAIEKNKIQNLNVTRYFIRKINRNAVVFSSNT